MKIFQNQSDKIIFGDVIDGLGDILDESIDLIFADPPYNIGKDFDGIHDKVDEDAFQSWTKSWIKECKRVLKQSGSFYVMNSTQNMPWIDLYCRSEFHIISRIIWAYDSSGVQAKRYFGSLYEPILMMSKSPKAYTFNSDEILVEAKTGSERKLIDYRKNPPQPYNTKKVPGNVWEFPRVRYKMEEYENHPTQKPEAMLERVVKASSNEGDTVLDPFSGSFTTAFVAKKLNRKTVSIEKNEQYVKIGLRRLEVPSDYKVEELEKVKVRKTNNKSKKDRRDGSQPSLI